MEPKRKDRKTRGTSWPLEQIRDWLLTDVPQERASVGKHFGRSRSSKEISAGLNLREGQDFLAE